MIKYFPRNLTLLLVIAGCTHGKSDKIQRINWLIGSWKMTTQEGSFIEAWSKESDTSIIGNGFFITTGNDTPFREKLSIVQMKDTLYYIAITKGNHNKPVLFKEKRLNENELLFENPEHDFPQQIHYRKLSDTTIKAVVSGIEKGSFHKEEFNLVKQP